MYFLLTLPDSRSSRSGGEDGDVGVMDSTAAEYNDYVIVVTV